MDIYLPEIILIMQWGLDAYYLGLFRYSEVAVELAASETYYNYSQCKSQW